MKQISYVILTGMLVFFSLSGVNAVESTCRIQSKVDDCVANQNNVRQVTDYVCINGSRADIAYQIVIDDKFQEVDKVINDYLITLETNKNYYFGPDAREDYLAGIETITRRFSPGGEYWNAMTQVCSINTVIEATECLDGGSPIGVAKDYFADGTACMKLARTKIEIYKEVAYNILPLNKHQVRKDSQKLYVQKERSNYDKLLDIIAINLGYIERIWKKWPSKTEKPHKG